MRVPFSPPRIDDLIINEVVDTLKSGWITTGPKTKLFEKKISDYCNAEKVLCLSSATAGLELVLRWFGVTEGDEVIVPAYTYCATANVVLHCGAKVIFAEVSEDDFNLDLNFLEGLITEKTKVIIPVDIAGWPCDYTDILDLVSQKKDIFIPLTFEQKQLGRILVLSDSAHSLGSIYNNVKSAICADVTVFSFHAVKNLTTAEGGAIVFNLPQPFNNIELYNYFNIFSLHGQNKDALQKTIGGGWRYDVLMPGYKANMTDINASIGLVEIERYENDTLVKRKNIFEFYDSKFKNFNWAITPIFKTEKKTSSFHVYLLRIKDISEAERDLIIDYIFKKGVSVNVHFIPVPMLKAYSELGYKISSYPKSYKNYSTVISLPVFYDITDNQLEFVVNTVIEAVKIILNYD